MSISTILAGSVCAQKQIQIHEVISDERGFAGAVRVEETWESNSWGYVTVAIPYLGISGEKREGQARFYYKPEFLMSGNRIPVFCGVHYEVTEETARKYCELGFAVVTPHCGKIPLEFVFGNSYNLSKAIIQWVRRLPIVDRTRLQIGGESAGGYMTLAMGAEFFPVSALISDVPAVNWAYGCNYLLANQKSSGCFQPAEKTRPLPVLALIAPGADIATKLFGDNLSSRTWYTLSPISYINRITAPTMVMCATGDMLCTIDMFTAKQFFTLGHKKFPKTYQRDFEKLTLCPEARQRLDECIPEEKLATYIIPLPKGLHEFTREDWKNPGEPARGLPTPPEIDRPWSKEKQWTLVILNEGAPLPHTGHTRYYWNTTARAFMTHHQNCKTGVSQLNATKLRRLMERYAGRLSEVATLANGTPANRLNFDNLERLDVLTGLLDYTRSGPKHVQKLKKLYRASSVKPFGKELRLKHLEELHLLLSLNQTENKERGGLEGGN